MEFKSEFVSDHITRIGKAPFDPTFGLRRVQHPLMMDFFHVVVWRESGDRVDGIGAFISFTAAEEYVKVHRNELINQNFEKIVLT